MSTDDPFQIPDTERELVFNENEFVQCFDNHCEQSFMPPEVASSRSQSQEQDDVTEKLLVDALQKNVETRKATQQSSNSESDEDDFFDCEDESHQQEASRSTRQSQSEAEKKPESPEVPEAKQVAVETPKSDEYRMFKNDGSS